MRRNLVWLRRIDSINRGPTSVGKVRWSFGFHGQQILGKNGSFGVSGGRLWIRMDSSHGSLAIRLVVARRRMHSSIFVISRCCNRNVAGSWTRNSRTLSFLSRREALSTMKLSTTCRETLERRIIGRNIVRSLLEKHTERTRITFHRYV
jgi:hypothetical protein